MKKILPIVAVVVLVAIGSFLVYYFYFSEAGKQATVDKENFVIAQLIREEIGVFNIKKAYDYQDGVIMNVYRQNADMTENFTFFYKDGQLQSLPNEYLLSLAKDQLSDAEKQNKLVALTYLKEYNTNTKDKEGKDIIYQRVFLVTYELPQSEWDESAMYVGGPAKYQVIMLDEFGNFQSKFLSSQKINIK